MGYKSRYYRFYVSRKHISILGKMKSLLAVCVVFACASMAFGWPERRFMKRSCNIAKAGPCMQAAGANGQADPCGSARATLACVTDNGCTGADLGQPGMETIMQEQIDMLAQ